MSFLDDIGLGSFSGSSGAAGLVSIGVSLAGGLLGKSGADKASSALENQAAFQLNLGQRKADWAKELSLTESELILQQGEDEATIAEFNAGQARKNAEFAARAGTLDLLASEQKWKEQTSLVRAQFAASGLLLTDTPIAVLAEQFAEGEKEAYRIRLNTENAVARANGEADLYSIQGAMARAAAAKKAAARVRAGEIDAETSLLTGGINAETSRIQADTESTKGLGSLLGAFGTAASSYVAYTKGVSLSKYT